MLSNSSLACNTRACMQTCPWWFRIKDGTWDVFAKETESQEVRSHALRPLRQLLKLQPPTLAADRWKVWHQRFSS